MRASRSTARAVVVLGVAAAAVVVTPATSTSAGPAAPGTAIDAGAAGSLAAFGSTMTALSVRSARLLPVEPSVQLADTRPRRSEPAPAPRRPAVRSTPPTAPTTAPAVAAPAVPEKSPAAHVIPSYVVAPEDQAAVDRCRLVLWWRSPDLLAGHDWCGFAWFARLRPGERLDVSAGPVAGSYVVVSRVELARQSGPLPAFDADLVLQTCVGDRTSFALLRRASA